MVQRSARTPLLIGSLSSALQAAVCWRLGVALRQVAWYDYDLDRATRGGGPLPSEYFSTPIDLVVKPLRVLISELLLTGLFGEQDVERF